MRFCPFDGTELEASSSAVRPNRPSLGGFETKDTGMTGALLNGRYKIVGFVSKGATARVYLAEDVNDHGVVAVKMFAPAVRERDVMRERFTREADALRAIRHPNVVRVLDSGEVDAAPFVVMEALRGETLGDRLKREGPLYDKTAVRYAREAAAGLVAAHRAGVIHRDIKPDNLFITDEDSVKVIDFGMAKVVRDRGSSAEMVMGTVQYMSPEQIVSESVDERTDVYALGVVLFRMLTGHLPFDVELSTDLLGHQLFSPTPPPSWLDDDLDPNLERVILCAMRKDPANRYPSMEAFCDDLARRNPVGCPLTVEPDVYTPRTPAGREAAQFLSRGFRVDS
jgi:eukaryotic-like serine/threonine-protein kinase